ncbi:unnamed protein product [Caenorhabditis sp. 36 PRJEB53466]|nr:unnamed protein product [Caenorhabditis sp. 36 PRJEB53466]
MDNLLNALQNIKCGWSGCALTFGSEIDMNMHVMMNHMILLEHGEFVLNRRAHNRKRAAREISQVVVQTEPNSPISVQNLDASASQKPVRQKTLKITTNPVPMPQEDVKPTIAHPNLLLVPKSEFPRVAPQIPASSHRNVSPPAETGSSWHSSAESEPIPPIRVTPMSQGQFPVVAQLLRRVQKNQREEWQNLMENENNKMGVEPEDVHTGSDDVEAGDNVIYRPKRLSEVVDDFLERLKPMKQLGFIRQHRTVYCIVCLKYTRSFHECNWKHTPEEERVVEMWYRRYGPDKPTGKTQLMREFAEIKEWLLKEEAAGKNLDTLY